ncbi:MAG: head-tail joining protein [Commensalibacter sp.]
MSLDFQSLVLGPCMNTFGQKVLYHPQDPENDPFEVRIIFDQVTDQIIKDDNLGGGSGVVVKKTMAGINRKDFPVQPCAGDYLICNDVTYFVQKVLDDGQGGSHLLLNCGENNG